MRLYQHPFSTNSRRATLTAVHLGAPVELVLVDLAKGEQRQPGFLKMNPNGKVPVLEDGDFFLWESYAIMQYLADRTPGQSVYPTDVRGRADVNRWLSWCSQHFSPAVGIFIWENVVKGAIGLGGPDPAELQRGEALLSTYTRVLDGHLAGREWICGSNLTLADFAIAAPLGYAVPAKLPVAEYENVQAWFARVQRLEAWKKTSM